jgi:hypothetical protein
VSAVFGPTPNQSVGRARAIGAELVSGDRRIKVGERVVMRSGVVWEREKLERGQELGLYRNGRRVSHPENHLRELEAIAADIGI